VIGRDDSASTYQIADAVATNVRELGRGSTGAAVFSALGEPLCHGRGPCPSYQPPLPVTQSTLNTWVVLTAEHATPIECHLGTGPAASLVS
jgi:hypothetical protein